MDLLTENEKELQCNEIPQLLQELRELLEYRNKRKELWKQGTTNYATEVGMARGLMQAIQCLEEHSFIPETI